MILYLATHCKKGISRFFIAVFYLSIVTASWSRGLSPVASSYHAPSISEKKKGGHPQLMGRPGNQPVIVPKGTVAEEGFSGGPTQPEMASFKPVSADNLVNLFTGDFSYNIPLLDVGGYPVNIFYDGNITPEQEASWVGLGWNINPGAVTRNMRGVPDDFNGTDILKQTQAMKANKTFGVNVGADIEIFGTKPSELYPDFLTESISTGFTAGVNLGVSFNNYLGPALDFAVKGGYSFSFAKKSGTEKSPFGMGVGLNINNSSRNGVTISPNVSFNASMQVTGRNFTEGIGLSTGYNARSGIRSLQLYDQVSMSKTDSKAGFKGEGVNISNSSHSFGANMYSHSINFAKPSYIPTMRMPITNTAGSGHFQLGGAFWGQELDFEAEVSMQKSEIADEDKNQVKPLVGYLYYEKANNNPNAVMDFARIGDKEVTPNTPIISAPQYTYDVFTINGEGTGGTIRPYRNDLGYVRDNVTRSKDRSTSAGLDIGIPGQYGGNFSTVKTPSTVGEWMDGNKLRQAIPFKERSGSFENVYFRNPGESSVLQNNQFTAIGGTDLVRYVLGGSGESPTIEPTLKRIDKTGNGAVLSNADLSGYNTAMATAERKKRTQVINFLTAEDAQRIGLDKNIVNYSQTAILKSDNTLNYETMPRYYPVTDNATGHYRKPHHISQINVTENDGKRYIYGIPVYNITQTDFTFSVNNPISTAYPDGANVDANNMVSYAANNATPASTLLSESTGNLIDGYVQTSTTPAYAHSFLLSGLLSPDYVDLTGDGITEDDLGNAVKFNYSKMATDYKWRTPHTAAIANDAATPPTLGKANFNPGNRSSSKDDKGLLVYGERESWYLHSVESKTMIAIFTLGKRYDGKGAASEKGGIATSDTSIRKLEKIDLYSKADLKQNGLISPSNPSGAKPIKTVHFEYSYKLCRGTTDNDASVAGTTENPNQGGKLTLERIYFTFNGQSRASRNQYVFGYGNTDANTADNPNYVANASDRWGNYKPVSANPSSLKNADYPYSAQPSAALTQQTINQQAAAWCLKKVLLPSGGQIEVEYESDDYAFVQNKKATVMMGIVGFTYDPTNTAVALSNELYSLSPVGIPRENRYAVVNIGPCIDAYGNACTRTKEQIKQQYLGGQTQLAFRLAVKMPKGYEHLTSYAEIEDCDYMPGSTTQIWIKLKEAGDDHLSPLALTAIEYLREQLPGQAYPAYDIADQSSIKQIGSMLIAMLDGLVEAFQDQVSYLRSKNFARYVDLSKSFVRLAQPSGHKMGGGNRVKSVIIRNNWNRMTEKKDGSGAVIVSGEAASFYGQAYKYETTEVLNGVERPISSGVASYEPGIGGEENPFQTMLQVANSVAWGPTSYGSIEMPFLDALFPAPVVGYSKVTVTSIKNHPDQATKQTRSGIGKQVTEFYTTKDYPVKWSYTSLDGESTKEEHHNSFAFFWKNMLDTKALSQGFLVELNDMNGKVKSQASYPENDDKTPVNYTQNYYRNIGDKGLDEKFDFASTSSNGGVTAGNMGIDIELMTDAREFKVYSYSKEVQAQIDDFLFGLGWVPFIWPTLAESENTYRAVTCTKVINYHSVVDKVVVVDKGSMVSTENKVFDAETGQVIVNKTNNEFDKPIYSTTYPAYWAYSGMGLAYKNIDATFTGVTFLDGAITSGVASPADIFESGDEIYVKGDDPSGCGLVLSNLNDCANTQLIWAYDRDKDLSTSLTNTAPNFIFLDKDGQPYTRSNVTLRIVRSGKRNMLGTPAASVTSMTDPVSGSSGQIDINSSSKVVAASAAEYLERWQTDRDVIKRKQIFYNSSTCSEYEIDACTGYLNKRINPYTKGLLGTFHSWRNRTLYGNRTGTDASGQTALPENGFVDNFQLFWVFNTPHNLVPSPSALWVVNSQLTRINGRGMELETKDALDIYTAAQYSYNKDFPVAMGSNTRYNEMGVANFENDDVDAALRPLPGGGPSGGSGSSCSKGHLDFSSVSTTIVAGDEGFNAHTGKKVLKIGAGSLALAKQIPVGDNNVPFAANNFSFGSKTPTVLANPGITISNIASSVSSLTSLLTLTDFSYGNSTINMNVIPKYLKMLSSGSAAGYDYTFNTTEYFETAGGIYTVYEKVNAAGALAGVSSTQSSSMGIKITSVESGTEFSLDPINTTFGTSPGSEDVKEFTVCLPKGKYKIYSTCFIGYQANCDSNPNDFIVDGIDCRTEALNSAALYCTHNFTFYLTPSGGSAAIIGYQDLSSMSSCTYTTPIEGAEQMLNPEFSILPNKKMLFSSWAREAVTGPVQTYTNSVVELSFKDASGNPIGSTISISPAGPIIEGWQKLEKEFTAPTGAVTMECLLKNNSSTANNYWDDIRIHPFNANLKAYVYDPINLRLVAELDANNYASFYEYDEEGTLIRTKAETREGIKTIKETRSAKQKKITDLQ